MNLLEFFEKCLPNIFVGILLHILINNPAFIKISLISPILIILLVVIISLFKTHKERIINYFKALIRSPNLSQILKDLIVPLFVGIFLGLIIAQILIPVFEITYPENNHSVNQIITVEGHGAIPSSEIKGFVIDDLGTIWPQGTTSSDTRGNWELHSVRIGDSGDKDKGKMYTIYALMNTHGLNYSTKEVHVRRE